MNAINTCQSKSSSLEKLLDDFTAHIRHFLKDENKCKIDNIFDILSNRGAYKERDTFTFVILFFGF